MLLSGNVAIVTGGATLFGQAVVQTLVDEGASVLVADINAEGGRDCVAALGDSGLFLEADIGSDDAVARVVSETLGRWGRIDVLVNLACS